MGFDLDLLAERAAARVYLGAQPRRARLGDHLVAKRQEVVAHGEQPQLRRREPKGKVAGSALDEDAEEALNGSLEGEEVRVRRFGRGGSGERGLGEEIRVIERCG